MYLEKQHMYEKFWYLRTSINCNRLRLTFAESCRKINRRSAKPWQQWYRQANLRAWNFHSSKAFWKFKFGNGGNNQRDKRNHTRLYNNTVAYHIDFNLRESCGFSPVYFNSKLHSPGVGEAKDSTPNTIKHLFMQPGRERFSGRSRRVASNCCLLVFKLCYATALFGHGSMSKIFGDIDNCSPPGHHNGTVYHDCLPYGLL